MDVAKQGIMVTIDSLLDTRLSTVGLCNENWALELLKNGWKDRDTNSYESMCPSIDMVEVNARWERRDFEVLKYASMTEIVHVVRLMRDKLGTEMALNPKINEVWVEVNYYPYSLNREQLEQYKMVFQHLFEIEVCLVSIPPELLTSKYIAGTYAAMIVHDIDWWIKPIEEDLKQMRNPEIQVFAPQMFNAEITDKERQEYKLSFDFMSFLYSSRIGINWLPTTAYTNVHAI